MLTKVTGTTQVLTVGTSSEQTTVLTNITKIRIAVTVDTHVKIASDSTIAGVTDMIMPAGTTEHFTLPDTSSYVSVLRVGSTSGKASITPIA